MPEWVTGITLIPAAVLLILRMRDRKRLSRKLGELASQQAETSRILNELIDESGKIALEFTRLLPATPSAAFNPPMRGTRDSEPRRKGVEKRHMVLNLAHKGYTAREISEQLMLPAGEVDLILSLTQSRRTQVSA